MENKNTLIAIAISAIVSSACTATALKLSADSNVTENSNLGTITAQVAELKEQLAIESLARASLEQQVFNRPVSSTLGPTASNASPSDAPQTQVNNDSQLTQQERVQQFREQRRAEQLARQQPGFRTEQLVNAGFAQEEAARIVQIESEESLRVLQENYEFRRAQAAREGEQVIVSNPIRAELGDQNYERYLEANGRPTSARVGSVIGGSPAESAGLIAGDNLVSYAGERVFDLNDINNLTIQGNVGESVLIEVERNGQPLQLTIPRGPIGVSSGRRFRRR